MQPSVNSNSQTWFAPLLFFWQAITLATLPLQGIAQHSFIYHWVGLLQRWRRSSWLMQSADLLGLILLGLVFALSPFVSNSLTGVLLIACGGFWVLVTISDDRSLNTQSPENTATDRAREDLEPSRKILTGFTPIHLLVLLYWGLAIIATVLSPVRKAAIPGLVKLTLFMVVFALMARVLRSPRFRSWLITLYLHVSLIVSVYGLRQWFFGADAPATWVDPTSPLSKMTRIYSYLGNPNLLAGYLLPAVIFSLVAIFAWQGWLPKLLAVVMVICNGACLVLTFSRGGWIGMVIAIFALLIFLIDWWSVLLPGIWRALALPIVLGGATAFLVVAIVLVDPLRDRVLSMFAGRGDSSNNFRINVWAAVLQMIQKYPVLGIGPGNQAFQQIYRLYARPRFTALGAYSVILETAVETGLLGLTCFLWMILVTLNQGWQQLRHLRETRNPQGFLLIGAMASILGMLGHGLVDTVWYRPQVNTIWWLMIAIVAGFYRPSLPETDPSPAANNSLLLEE